MPAPNRCVCFAADVCHVSLQTEPGLSMIAEAVLGARKVFQRTTV